MPRSRAELLPDSRQHRLSDWNLRQSLASIGQLSPVLYFREELIDGARRMKMMCMLDLEPKMRVIDDRIEAARTLWALHPARAYKRFAEPRSSSKALQALFNCNPRDIPTSRQAQDHKRSRHPVSSPSLARAPSVPIHRSVYEQAQAACKAHGVSVSSMLRYYLHELAGQPITHPVAVKQSGAAE